MVLSWWVHGGSILLRGVSTLLSCVGGVPMVSPWCLRRAFVVDPSFAVRDFSHMPLWGLWCVHGASVVVGGGSMVGPWCVHGAPMVGPWCVHGTFVMLPSWLCGGSMVLPWKVRGGSVVGPWCFRGASVVGLWWMHGVSVEGPCGGSVVSP